MIFNGEEHEMFYNKYVSNDPYRNALFYLVGVSDTTRYNIKAIYSFDERCIIPESLSAGWQTSSSRALTALAFDLYHGSPVLPQADPTQDQIEDALEIYSVSGIMSRLNEWIPYALEAIKIRYM